jgi:hypothetical protein
MKFLSNVLRKKHGENSIKIGLISGLHPYPLWRSTQGKISRFVLFARAKNLLLNYALFTCVHGNGKNRRLIDVIFSKYFWAIFSELDAGLACWKIDQSVSGNGEEFPYLRQRQP